MPIIKKLSTHEAQKIAAGEVVERPANIVKELVENALDAGATHITIHLENAGKHLVRVQDDGCGMDIDDARLCFEHHATSKITQVDDLHAINTFGFRGEALSSIASVSNVTLITKQKDADEGIKLDLTNGAIVNESAVPATVGTDITITNVFDTMPARKKFLKSKETEWRHIQQLFFALALDYIDISFKLYSENKLVYHCPAIESTQARWTQLLDHEVSNHLITLQTPHIADGITINGVISSQQYGRYDRNSIYMFVNNRWVKDYKLNRAMISGYNNALPTHQFPLGCIKIQVDPSWIDVNIHPRKEEVQFLHPQKIYNAIKQSVVFTLEQFISQKFNSGISAPKEQPATSAYEPAKPSLAFTPFNFDAFFHEPFATQSPPTTMQSAPKMPIASSAQNYAQPTEENAKILQEHEQKHHTILGVFQKTYILVEQEDGLMVIDQHAAHECILYEQFKNERNPATVQLMFPQTITLHKEDITLLIPHLTTLCTHGIEAELFSETQIAIKATPIQLKNASIEAIIKACVAALHQDKSDDMHHAFAKALHADMACKAAVKAGDTLSHDQIQQLLHDLEKTNNRFTCPHGRPTTWYLPLDTIKKKFKRDYRS